MDAIEILTKVKNILLGVEDTKNALLMTNKLKDGTEINIDKEFIVGAVVTTLDGQPVPDGDYTLEDGTAFKVAGGLIAEIAPTVPAEPVEQDAEPATLSLQEETDKRLTDLEASVSEMKTLMESFSAKFTEMMTKFETQTEETKLKLQEFGAQPAVKPTVIKPIVHTPLTRTEQMLQLRKEMKK